MLELSPVVLGFILVVLGLAFMGLTLALLRLIPRPQQAPIAPPLPPTSSQITNHTEAVLVVQTGGRVAYINQAAREIFSVWEDEPNLESLGRRTRPSEVFLSLCAGEGQARFTVNGRAVDGISYFAPGSLGKGAEQFSAMLVSIRRPQLVMDSDVLTGRGPGDAAALPTAHALTIFNELSQSMASSLELEPTLQTILESIERLLPSDFFEITVWDAEEQVLVPYRLVGLPGLDRHLEKATERYRPDQGYSGHLVNTRQPLLVKDINTYRQARPSLDRQRFPFQSYLGMPLLIAGDLIGTLELASLNRDNYSENDQEVLRLLTGQAAIALNNALLYQQELERSVELAGLASLAQTISSIRDPQDLYSRLIDSLSPLLPVEVLGFLVYDENRRVLEAQMPFMGIQPNVVEWYQTTILPDSSAEQVWQSAEPIVAMNAVDDERLKALELHHLAQAAGLRTTVLAPLHSGGRMLGYLQVANKRDGSHFDRHDLRFLAIVAGQSAPIIDNANLVQLSRRRAQRAETLRRIASLTSSTATLDEILKFSLLDLARLLQADMAAIFLLDEARGELRLHKASVFGVPPEVAGRFARLSTDDADFKQTISFTRQQFFAGSLEDPAEVAAMYQPLVADLHVRSAIDVPLVMRERGMGELMVGSFRPNFFSPGDLQTVATAAGQLAGAIEQTILYSQTDQSLRQRVEQLTALTRISRELNSTTMLGDLLQRVYDEALRTTHADCGTILLFNLDQQEMDALADQQQDQPVRIQLYLGDEPGASLHPLEEQVLHDGEALIVADFEPYDEKAHTGDLSGPVALYPSHRQAGEVRQGQRLQAAHDGIRSALVVPIAYQGAVAGLLHLHARSPNRFGPMEREIGEALAVQAAIALGNAQRYEEQKRRSELLNRRVETLSKLFEVSQILQAEQPLDQALEAIAYAIQAATPFDIVLISTYDAAKSQLVRVTAAGIPLPTLAELRSRPQPWASIQRLLDPGFRVGRAYFIPHDRRAGLVEGIDLHTPLPVSGRPVQGYSWHPQDIFFIPLFDTDNEPLGLISVDSPRNDLRPDQPTLETLEIFASQAGLIIESQQKVRDLRAQMVKVQADLELAQHSAQKAQAHLPALLHKDLEQTIAIQQLGQRSRRIAAGLDIAELVSKQPDQQGILAVLGRETLARMDFDVVLVAEPAPAGLSLTQTLGTIPPDVNPKALLGQRNPLRQALQTGRPMLVSNLGESPEWQNTPLLRALDTKSFLCLPIANLANGHGGQEPGAGRQAMAAVLAVSRSPLAPFTGEDEQLFDLMSRQVSVAMQNLHLLEDTSRRLQEVNLLLDFSRQLGSLDPASILRSLVENSLRAVPAAQSAMVALWDPALGMLTPRAAQGYANPAELMQVLYRPSEGLPGQVFLQKQAMVVDEVEFARHYNLTPENLLRYRNATGGRLPVSSLAVPILVVSAPRSGRGSNGDGEHADAERVKPLGVVVLDNAQVNAAFADSDLAVIASLAQQTALTLENARLYQASERRSEQLQALTQVSTDISASLQTEDLIASLLDRLLTILPYDTGTLWIRQQERGPRRGAGASGAGGTDRMIVRAARGFADSEQRVGLVVDVQDSQLLNEMTLTGQPLWVPDVREDARFQALRLVQEMLEESGQSLGAAGLGLENLSWLGVPLIASGTVTGVIALEKAEANFYTQGDIQAATAFAVQAAIGLENASLYQESVRRTQELDRRSQTLTILNRLSGDLSGALDAGRIMTLAVQVFLQIIPCTSATVLVVDEAAGTIDTRILLQDAYPEMPADARYRPGSRLPYLNLFDRLRETEGIYNSEDVQQEAELAQFQDFLGYYQTRSLLIIPVISTSSSGMGEVVSERRFHGMLLAHNSQPYRFSPADVELARTISNQVAISLQNARLFEETRDLTEYLELRVQQRTAELGREHQRSETLLRIITELSASLDLDQVLHRTLLVLSEYVDAKQITILIARPGERKLHRLASIGYTPEPDMDGSPTPLDVNQGLAGLVINQRQPVLVHDVREDERWVQLPYSDDRPRPAQEHRSVLGVPLMSGAEALGCLLLFHPEPSHFSADQLELVQAAGNQVAVAVNNAELYRLIRDQAEDLGGMLRSQQIETSRSQAILEAVADGVLVTDAQRKITLFNESAEKILGLERRQVLGKTMEHFAGLFGGGARNWLEQVSAWSQEPDSYQGDIYAEQITLEDGRVILVHLAPVNLRSDFLGTVSIFQDITHQVEVDRLKSEFVATVSHELRTPMTSIKGYVEILLMGAAGQLSDQQKHFLQVVKTNTERLTVLVNDLLDISAIEAGRIVLKSQPFSMEDLVSQAIAELERRMSGDEKGLTVVKEFAPGLPRVLGDPERIRRAVDILLDNAYQYNLPKGKIIVRLHQVGSEVQLDVKDTGVGISQAEQERVFERFFRGESPLMLGVAGTGLGLSIVQNLISMHNGRIWLESLGVSGEGSTFSFTLPVYQTDGM